MIEFDLKNLIPILAWYYFIYLYLILNIKNFRKILSNGLQWFTIKISFILNKKSFILKKNFNLDL